MEVVPIQPSDQRWHLSFVKKSASFLKIKPPWKKENETLRLQSILSNFDIASRKTYKKSHKVTV